MTSLPIVPTLALAPWITALMVVAFLFVCLLLILIILIQKPQGGGLSGAFGSGAASGSGQTVFGARTGDALTIGTITVFVLYLGVAIGLNYAIRPGSARSAAPAAQAPAQTAPATVPATDPPAAPQTTEPSDAEPRP